MESQKPLVTITGVAGYLGSQVCLLFLQNGQFRVRGTVRSLKNEDKVGPLKAAFGDLFNHLELVEADLLDEPSLMKAIEGATFVIHTASFISESKDYSLFEKPAIQGTLSVCKACHQHKVKRLVITSSVATIMEKNDRSQTVLTVNDWSDPEELEKDKPYEKSKTLAEQAAWKFVKDLPEAERFEMVTTLPGLIVGPNINKCNFTSGDFVKGFMMSDPDYEQLLNWHFPFVDVRDVALAHLQAVLIPEAAGQRFMLVADTCHWWRELGAWLDEVYGKKGMKKYNVSTQEIEDKAVIETLPSEIQAVWGKEFKYPNDSTKDVLKMQFTPIKQSVLEMAETLISTGYVPDLRQVKERTYIMIKPDGVQRGLIGEIMSRFETKGFKLVGMKLCQPGREMFEKHYADLSSKGFFKGLVDYAASGPVCCMVWEGDNAVKTGRKMLGATKPFDSEPGTIRGDFCIDVGRNVIHGSDSVESANAEIALWFTPAELVNWTNHSQAWVYE